MKKESQKFTIERVENDKNPFTKYLLDHSMIGTETMRQIAQMGDFDFTPYLISI